MIKDLEPMAPLSAGAYHWGVRLKRVIALAAPLCAALMLGAPEASSSPAPKVGTAAKSDKATKKKKKPKKITRDGDARPSADTAGAHPAAQQKDIATRQLHRPAAERHHRQTH